MTRDVAGTSNMLLWWTCGAQLLPGHMRIEECFVAAAGPGAGVAAYLKHVHQISRARARAFSYGAFHTGGAPGFFSAACRFRAFASCSAARRFVARTSASA